MRQLRYSVAASLDGYIAGPNGEFDWIVADPEIDFAAMYAGFSSLVMGRKSYDVYLATGGGVGPALPVHVCSRSLPEGTRYGVTFVHDGVSHVRSLKETDGKPLWLWGGGELFAEMARAGLVDGVDVAIIPVMIGAGLPLFPSAAGLRLPLALRSHRLYSGTGTLFLEYDVTRT